MVEYALKGKRSIRKKRGVTALEYAAAGAFIATAMLGVVGAVGNTINAQSHATLAEGTMLLASAKNELMRFATRSSSDPIQTGSTTDRQQAREATALNARKLSRKDPVQQAAPLCSGEDGARTCKLDLSHPSFQGWRGTIVEWDGDQGDADHDI